MIKKKMEKNAQTFVNVICENLKAFLVLEKWF